jgi:hypothetical protein
MVQDSLRLTTALLIALASGRSEAQLVVSTEAFQTLPPDAVISCEETRTPNAPRIHREFELRSPTGALRSAELFVEAGRPISITELRVSSAGLVGASARPVATGGWDGIAHHVVVEKRFRDSTPQRTASFTRPLAPDEELRADSLARELAAVACTR